MRKVVFPKTSRKSKSLGNKFWRNPRALKSKKVQGIFGETFIFGIIVFNCLSSTKPCLIFILIWFARETKGFYQSSLGNEVGFRDIINFSPSILAKNQNFQKRKHGFVDERALITRSLMSSRHWITFLTFCFRIKRTENAFLTLTMNYRKIVQKDKLCHPNQQ